MVKRCMAIFFVLFITSLAMSQTYIRPPALIEGVTVTAKAAGTTALTAASQTIQSFTGTSAETVDLPDATTLEIGRKFYILNTGASGLITVEDNGNNQVTTIPALGAKVVVLTAIPDADGTWELVGEVDVGSVTGILPLANGGTSKALTASAGSVVYSDADSMEMSAVGSSGQVLMSNGTSAPSWTASTIPSSITAPAALVVNTTDVISGLAATTANRLLRTDGSALSFAQADLTTDVTGVLPYANGGTNTNTSFTAGSVIYAGASSFAQENSTLFYDATTDALGVGTAVPTATMHSHMASASDNYVKITNSTTGATATDGFDVGVSSTGVALLRNRENSNMLFYTAGTAVMTLTTGKFLGVGPTPTHQIHQERGNSTATYHQWTAGSATGSTSTDGSLVGISSTGVMQIQNQENLAIEFYTNGNNKRAEIGAAGETTFYKPVLIDGAADEVQFTVQANATQTGNLVVFEDSSGNDLMQFAASTSQFTINRAPGSAGVNMRSANGTLSSPTVAADTNIVGIIRGYGYSAAATDYLIAADIRAVIDGTPDSGGDTSDMPGSLQFAVTAEGAGSPTVQADLGSDGIFSFYNGVKLKASGSGSTTLNHYEEGTCTPTLAFSGGLGTATASPSVCRYTKIGNRTHLSFYVTVTKGTGTGSMTFTGLPYASTNLTNFYQTCVASTFAGVTVPANRSMVIAYIGPNSSTLSLQFNSTNGGTNASLAASDLGATSEFIFSCDYQSI